MIVRGVRRPFGVDAPPVDEPASASRALRHPDPPSGKATFRQRLGLALLTGYVLVYFGEIVFWATPERAGMGALGVFAAWLAYSVFGYVFLSVVGGFRARGPAAVFLAGAVFGWFEEGIVLQTTWGSPDTPFPISIAFTALAWHALISVLVGWYLIRRVLAQDRPLRTAGVAASTGLFYGVWAISWWTEPPEPLKVLLDADRKDLILVRFGAYALVTTALLVVALWWFGRLRSTSFEASSAERWTLGLATLAYFGLVTVPAAPQALWVLPLLLGVTFLALERNRRAEVRSDAIAAFRRRVGIRSYLPLFCMPSVATAVYAVALVADVRLRTNLAIFYATSVLGAAAWIASIFVQLVRTRPPERVPEV